MKILANAKINLSLDIVGKRDDGYHMLQSIFMPIPFFDTLEIAPSDSTSFECSDTSLETPDNLVLKATRLFFKYTGISGGANIYLDKKIPYGAGLGGGSSDAAATLLALNEIFETKLDIDILSHLALQLGADVPFFIHGRTALVEGIGEIITPLPSLPSATIALSIPNIHVDTREAYRLVNWQKGTPASVDTQGAIIALKNQDLHGFCRCVHNIFEDPISRKHAEITRIKNQFLEQGALCASMTGSGSGVFAIFEDTVPEFESSVLSFKI